MTPRQTPRQRKKGKATTSRSPVRVTCAFCGGKRVDPFGIMSPISACTACSGRGYQDLATPVARCAFCRGTGVHPGSRNTCTTCHGIGTVEIPVHAMTCPGCGGSGRAADYEWPDSPLSCGCCRGKGVVFDPSAADAAREKARTHDAH